MKREGMTNRLHSLIDQERKKRMESENRNVLIITIIEEIADFCKVNVESIKSYKQEKAIPSLPVALKLAEYFNISVEELFQIDNYDQAIGNSKNKGSKPRPYNKSCRYGECENKVLSKGLCSKHYQQVRNGVIKIEEEL